MTALSEASAAHKEHICGAECTFEDEVRGTCILISSCDKCDEMWPCPFEQLRRRSMTLQWEVDLLTMRNAELRFALNRFGEHMPWCDRSDNVVCDCGLDAASMGTA